jgi:hypothetical protein
VQRRERQRRLDLQTLGTQHGDLARTSEQLVEKGRLTHTRLSPDHQRPRRPVIRPLHERLQELPLGLPTDQHATNLHVAVPAGSALNPAL